MVKGVPLTAKFIAVALIVIVVCFMLVPQIVVIGTSLSGSEYLSFPPVGLSLRWYNRILSSELYLEAAWTSLRVAVMVMIISVLVGTPAAIALTRFRFPGVDALGALFVSPLILPMIIIGIGLLMVLSSLGTAPTFWALVLGHVVITLPYVVRTVSAVLVDIDPHIEEAARIMGASWLQRYWFVLLPQCLQGIAAGAFFAFNISFDDVVVVLFLRAPDLETLPLRVYSELEFSPSPAIAAVSSIMIFITIGLIFVIDRVLGIGRAVR